jgi:hypothetical protein
MYPLIAIPSWLDPDSPYPDQEAFQTWSGIQIPLDIQPESPTLTAISEGQVFATYHFFTSYSGIRPGWRLTVTTPGNYYNDVYTVRGVENYSAGMGAHYEGTLARETQP